jgi:hypothetical protein
MLTGSEDGPTSPRRDAHRAKYVATLPSSAGSNATPIGFFVNAP